MILSTLSARLRSALKLGTPSASGVPLVNPDGSVVNLPLAVTANGGAAGLMTGDQAAYIARWQVIGRSVWASRATPASSKGNIIMITDVGTSQSTPPFTGTPFISSGNNWYPLGGQVIIAQYAGSIGSPIATITANGTTAQVFTLPQSIKIPAGMLFAGCSVHVRAVMRRSTPGASPVNASGIVWLGNTDGSINGPQCQLVPMGTVGGNTVIVEADADIYSAGYTLYPPVAGSVGTATDRVMTIANDAFVYAGVSGAFEAGALLQLLAIQVILKA